MPNKTTAETIGQRMGRLRRERGLTQVELAAKLGITQSNLSEYERGGHRLQGGHFIARVSQILGVSSDELLGLEESPSPPAGVRNRRLLRRVQEIERLPRRDQQALMRTIDAFLTAKVR